MESHGDRLAYAPWKAMEIDWLTRHGPWRAMETSAGGQPEVGLMLAARAHHAASSETI
jgi:hypothetical protein